MYGEAVSLQTTTPALPGGWGWDLPRRPGAKIFVACLFSSTNPETKDKPETIDANEIREHHKGRIGKLEYDLGYCNGQNQ